MSLELNAATHFSECHGQVWRYVTKVEKMFKKLLLFVDIDNICLNHDNFDDTLITPLHLCNASQHFSALFCYISLLYVFLVVLLKLRTIRIINFCLYNMFGSAWDGTVVQKVISNSRRGFGKTFAWVWCAKKSLANTAGISVRKRIVYLICLSNITFLKAPPAHRHHLNYQENLREMHIIMCILTCFWQFWG